MIHRLPPIPAIHRLVNRPGIPDLQLAPYDADPNSTATMQEWPPLSSDQKNPRKALNRTAR